jgi:hypothetical protein
MPRQFDAVVQSVSFTEEGIELVVTEVPPEAPPESTIFDIVTRMHEEMMQSLVNSAAASLPPAEPTTLTIERITPMENPPPPRMFDETAEIGFLFEFGRHILFGSSWMPEMPRRIFFSPISVLQPNYLGVIDSIEGEVVHLRRCPCRRHSPRKQMELFSGNV